MNARAALLPLLCTCIWIGSDTGCDQGTACEPDCSGRQCGLDPQCGTESCGTCAGDDETCNTATGQCEDGPSYWQPTAAAPIHWQWQLGEPLDTDSHLLPGVTVYDIDGLDTDSSVVADLHSRGFVVIAYLEFGDWSGSRADAESFPNAALGNEIVGWEGERWLDIRRQDVRDILAARLDMVQAKGFDAVEPDCIDGYANDTGFSLTYEDQIDFNTWIATACHSRGLSVGLKGDVDQAADLQPYFDWSLNEECFQFSECDGLQAFLDADKAVFQVEYTGDGDQCSAMNAMQINSTTRELDLGAPGSSGYTRLACIPDDQDTW